MSDNDMKNPPGWLASFSDLRAAFLRQLLPRNPTSYRSSSRMTYAWRRVRASRFPRMSTDRIETAVFPRDHQHGTLRKGWPSGRIRGSVSRRPDHGFRIRRVRDAGSGILDALRLCRHRCGHPRVRNVGRRSGPLGSYRIGGVLRPDRVGRRAALEQRQRRPCPESPTSECRNGTWRRWIRRLWKRSILAKLWRIFIAMPSSTAASSRISSSRGRSSEFCRRSGPRPSSFVTRSRSWPNIRFTTNSGPDGSRIWRLSQCRLTWSPAGRITDCTRAARCWASNSSVPRTNGSRSTGARNGSTTIRVNPWSDSAAFSIIIWKASTTVGMRFRLFATSVVTLSMWDSVDPIHGNTVLALGTAGDNHSCTIAPVIEIGRQAERAGRQIAMISAVISDGAAQDDGTSRRDRNAAAARKFDVRCRSCG